MSAPTEPQRHKLAAARLWAATKYPYLAAALFAADVAVDERVRSVAADERWRFYVHPSVLDDWTVPQLGHELVHHAGHLLRDHADRARAHDVHEGDFGDWVTAADCEINDDLPAGDVELPEPPVQPRDIGAVPGRFAEEYYQIVKRRDAGEQSARDCGSASHGMPRDYEGDEGGLGRHERQLLQRRVARDVREHAQQRGTVPAGWSRWADELAQSRVDWRRVLAAEIRRGINQSAGAVDYTYRRPSRRAHAVRSVVLPSLQQPVPEIAVVCDTSGSMKEALLSQVLAEVDGLLRTAGVRADSVRVIACDAAAHAAQRVRSATDLQLFGGGGTDMGAGIAAAVALRPRPSVIVVLTDGYTPWPATPPKGTRVVVGLLGPWAPAAPSWARAVRIEAA